MIWSEQAVRVRAPATSANLGPGFDALGLALALHDEVEARITGHGVSVTVSGEGADTAGLGERHLVVRAMRTAFGAMGGQPPGISLACVNSIPHGRGLGSSAAAICTGLRAARGLVPDGLARMPDQELFRLAVDLEGHPDNVAACLAGGLVIAWRPVAAGAGGARLLRLGAVGGLSVVACVPPFPLPTHEARQVLPATVPHADAAANAARAALLVAALTGEPPAVAGPSERTGPSARTGEPSVLFEATEDFLHQPYRAAVMPETADLLGRLRKAGLAAVVSGAGPSVLIVSVPGEPLVSVPGEPPGREIPEVVDSIARETGITWRVIPLDIDRQGVTVQPIGMDAHQSGSARQGRSWNHAPGPGTRSAGGSPQDRPVSSASHGPP